jgi:hypothetical protein
MAGGGYDSAWAAAGIIGEHEENCIYIKDPRPPQFMIKNIVLGHTGEASVSARLRQPCRSSGATRPDGGARAGPGCLVFTLPERERVSERESERESVRARAREREGGRERAER